MNHLRHQNYKNENTETKYINNKNRALKVKKRLFARKKLVQLVNELYSQAHEHVGGVKENMSLFKARRTKDYNKPTCFKNMFRVGKKPKKLKLKNNLETT